MAHTKIQRYMSSCHRGISAEIMHFYYLYLASSFDQGLHLQLLTSVHGPAAVCCHSSLSHLDSPKGENVIY